MLPMEGTTPVSPAVGIPSVLYVYMLHLFPLHIHVYTIVLFIAYVFWTEYLQHSGVFAIFQFLLLELYSAVFIVSLNINEHNIIKYKLVSGKSALLFFSQSPSLKQ